MSVKKIVISPSNTKAITFLNDLSIRKAEITKKVENSSLVNSLLKKKGK